MSSDRCQNDHTIMDYLFVGPAGPAGRPIFVETPAGYYVKFHFLPIFDQKNWVVGWCFPTHEIKMFKIQKNTFQMLLISCHLDIVGRFSAQMKFEQLSRILYFFCISSVFVLYFFCISFVFLLYFFCISSVFVKMFDFFEILPNFIRAENWTTMSKMHENCCIKKLLPCIL